MAILSPVNDAMLRAGGVCDRATLDRAATRVQIDRAITGGLIVRLRRGRYALPAAQEHRRMAHRMSAVLSHRSAAAHWEWPMKNIPTRAAVTVPRHRKVSATDQAAVDVSWRRLGDGDVVAGVTVPVRTVVDCALTLPFDQALAIADSALRAKDVSADDLRVTAERMRGPGRRAVGRVAAEANAMAANPFESVLRAISLEVPGLLMVPQVAISDSGLVLHPDLVDSSLRIVAEADSFEFHGKRDALDRDCERYDELAVHGWLVLRFSWEQVMHRPEWVRWVLSAATAQRLGLAIPVNPARDRPDSEEWPV